MDKKKLAAVGGGTVTEVERADSSQVEVHLDRAFDVVGRGVGDDGPNDKDGPDED